MELSKQLIDLGLNDKQASVYLAVLELGKASVLDISRRATIKRPTAYVILDELLELGLVSELKTGKTTLFLPQEPERIGERLKGQMSTFRSIKPLLDDMYLKEGSKPNIRYYSGIAKIQELYEMFLVEHSVIEIFGGSFKTFSQSAAPRDYEQSRSGQSSMQRIRQILPMSEANLEYAKGRSSEHHKVHLIDPQFQLLGDNAIFGNTVLITSTSGNPFAIAIESKDVAQTFRSLFEVAWASSHALGGTL